MPDQTDTSDAPDTLTLLRRRPAQVAAIGAVLATSVAAFAWAGGAFSPGRLDPARITDAIEGTGGGAHAGFRRAHAKGICIAGRFVGTPAGRILSRAAVFDGRAVPVTGRFAEGTPDPYARDPELGVRSMALSLMPPGAQEWRMAINDTPGLAVSTPEDFYANAVASRKDPATGKPDPARVKAFLDTHPDARAFMARMKAKPLASGFANDSYNSINGFVFVAPDGTRRLVRWSMQAREPFRTLDPAVRKARGANYMFDDLLARVAQGPIRWRLVATIAEPGDPNRAAKLWPEDRRKVDMGELTITRAYAEAPGNCRDVNFDPLILPDGIAPSDDPIPFARSAVYAVSFRRREGEAKAAGAITNRAAGAIR